MAWTWYAISVWILAAALLQGRWLVAAAILLTGCVVYWVRLVAPSRVAVKAPWLLIPLTPLVIGIWIFLAGSYSPLRDIVLCGCVGLAVIAALSDWRSSVPTSMKRGLALQGIWLTFSWMAIGAADGVFESRALEMSGKTDSTFAARDEWKNLNVGLALSGGGYRAALVHAGVLEELRAMGVPVRAISSVSGGSIIGGFIAAGGTPVEFVEAVKAGRFHLFRDLTWPSNAVRLPAPLRVDWLGLDLWPLGGRTRLEVQASLLDRVLLHGVAASNVPANGAPRLIVNATDLHYGLSVGFLKDGILLYGPLTDALVAQSLTFMPDADLRPAYFRIGQSLQTDPFPRLSERVAISGAFPGAFPARDVQLPVRTGNRQSTLRLQLVDGGVRDNLGINSLLLADRLARQGDKVGSSLLVNPDVMSEVWRMDLIIASDGGQVLGVPNQLAGLGAVMRAVELNGLATGAMRPVPIGTDPSVVVLWENQVRAFAPDDILIGISPDQREKRPEDIISANIGNDTLIKLGSRFPDQQHVAPLIKMLQAAMQSGDRSGYCDDETKTPLGCASAALAREVGADIWHTFEVFSQTATLKDSFRKDEADAIVRYGKYLARINEGLIAKEMTTALVRQQKFSP